MTFFRRESFDPAAVHLVLGTALGGPWPLPCERIGFAMGCFWGAEKKLWQVPGVMCTRVGYQGGTAESPTYRQVCSGLTRHTEVVEVIYDPTRTELLDLLRVFWENHDPTQGDRQGNDIGSQYRSAVFCTTPAQMELTLRTRDAYAGALAAAGLSAITTQLAMVDESAGHNLFYPAEDYHQQYLVKNPTGYDCHAHTGVYLPALD